MQPNAWDQLSMKLYTSVFVVLQAWRYGTVSWCGLKAPCAHAQVMAVTFAISLGHFTAAHAAGGARCSGVKGNTMRG